MNLELIPIFLGVLAVFAGIINIFIVFILKILWSEIKDNQSHLDKEINGVYKEMRKNQDARDADRASVDEQLHQIKTQLIQIGLHLKIDFKST